MYQEYNEYKRQLLEYEEAQRSVDNQLKYAKAQIDKLKKTNVFNATFHIWYVTCKVLTFLMNASNYNLI